MKILISFLKSISIICLSLFLPFFNCSTDVDIQTVEIPPPLTDVLTFELSFGDENTITKDEFLLAQPRGIAVSSVNDIFVIDEECIKVFDSNGKEKSIVGRPGQGPGEFSSAGSPVVNPGGYLAVIDGGSSFNLFAPDLTFIEKKNYYTDFNLTAFRKEHGYYSNFMLRRVYPVDELIKILYFDSWKKLDETPDIYRSLESRVLIHDHIISDALVYDNDGEYVELASYYPKGLNDKNLLVAQTPYGKHYEKPFQQFQFLCAMLPGNRIIYTNPVFDTRTVNSE
ncbi:hypothetical protein AMJ80_00020 [bacterium SM23_31]|nr:MAG: hypothetical protein AMJ80_00020 [bacterium SM23_31]